MDYDKSPKAETLPILPKEMLEEIFQRLPFRDLLKCREVHSTWKSAATNPLRKRCAPLNFSRKEIPSRNQCRRAVKSFIELIRATNEHGGLTEIPVTKFHLKLYENYYWIEVDGSTLICRLLEAVRPFVKEIIFDLKKQFRQLPNNSLAILQDWRFPNLTEITLEMFEPKGRKKFSHCDSGIFSFIKRISEKSPNIKEFHLELEFDFYSNKLPQSENVRRCIVDTGIHQRASLVTSLIMDYQISEGDLKYLSKIGPKLKHLETRIDDVNPEVWKKFLGGQSDTLTSLSVSFEKSHYFRELPCLPRLKNLSIFGFGKCEDEKDQLPTLFYEERLPALKKLDLQHASEKGLEDFMASHLAPAESLRELIFFGSIEDAGIAGGVLQHVARIFPNLKKLTVFHHSAREYMSDIYETLPGIEELCISTEGAMTVDDIITGLPTRILSKISNKSPPSYYWCKALAMLERGTTKSLACLENLKVLEIYRRVDDEFGDIEGDVGDVDFTELSGAVLKQMKVLERIDFGIREYGPTVKAAIQQDLEARGIKLSFQLPPYTPLRTDFIGSLTESHNSGSDSD